VQVGEIGREEAAFALKEMISGKRADIFYHGE